MPKVTVTEIRNIMALMVQNFSAAQGQINTKGIPYNNQRSIISGTFNGGGTGAGANANTGTVSMGNILLRLVVLNAYYSTNASYSYFSLENLAEQIDSGTTKYAKQAGKLPSDFFYDMVLQNMAAPTTTGVNLFSRPYGMKKDATNGSTLTSLISKYAYYCLLMNPQRYPLGFPIYDDLARETYGKVMRAIGLKPLSKSALVIENAITNPQSKGSIGLYIFALNELREAIFGKNNTSLFHGMQQFDILDAYLWRMGKLEGGNLSLLLTKSEYHMLINYVKPTPSKKVGNRWTNTINEQIEKTLRRQGAAPFAAIADTQRKKFLTAMINHWRKL